MLSQSKKRLVASRQIKAAAAAAFDSLRPPSAAVLRCTHSTHLLPRSTPTSRTFVLTRSLSKITCDQPAQRSQACAYVRALALASPGATPIRLIVSSRGVAGSSPSRCLSLHACSVLVLRRRLVLARRRRVSLLAPHVPRCGGRLRRQRQSGARRRRHAPAVGVQQPLKPFLTESPLGSRRWLAVLPVPLLPQTWDALHSPHFASTLTAVMETAERSSNSGKEEEGAATRGGGVLCNVQFSVQRVSEHSSAQLEDAVLRVFMRWEAVQQQRAKRTAALTKNGAVVHDVH